MDLMCISRYTWFMSSHTAGCPLMWNMAKNEILGRENIFFFIEKGKDFSRKTATSNKGNQKTHSDGLRTNDS